MNRTTKRGIKKNERKLTSLAQRLLIRMLKKYEIDYVRSGDKIISTRNKEVDKLYDQAMMEVIVTFERTGGSLSKTKKYYGFK